jgi:hypothetical protein
MIIGQALRGQPLAALILIVGGWIVFRAMIWQPPIWAADRAGPGRPIAAGTHTRVTSPVMGTVIPGMSLPPMAGYWPAIPQPMQRYGQAMPVGPQGGWYGSATEPQAMMRYPAYAAPLDSASVSAGQGDDPMLAAGHQLMWMAALARVAVPPELSAYVGQSTPAAPAPIPLSPGLARNGPGDRWSLDAWMLMRQQGAINPAAARPLYGGSQIGAVLRYQLAPQNAHRPMVYLRGSSSMGAIRESEVAAGIGARPIAGFPLVVAGEARAFRSGGDTSFRPAAIAYTELQPIELPWDLLGDAYFQGGYVGGKFKTLFADGQVRIDHKLMNIGPGGEVRVGAGIWGGAQKGAKRLDIGPGATARLKLAGRPSRVSMDYRFRVAGDASPGSGPALTVSTGF